jgi:TetR/AcrR family transcriptional regulator, transcriptional repressor for nem operon
MKNPSATEFPLDLSLLIDRLICMGEKETRTQILDVAQDLIQRLGANGMSYSHISEAVGIRKASIHYYFPSKESLIEALLERYSAYFLGLVDEIVSDRVDARTKLLRYVSLFEATLCGGNRDKACLCGMLGAELASLGSESANRLRRFFTENEDRLTLILEQGKTEGLFAFSGESRDVAKLIFALLEGSVLIARAQDGAKHFFSIRQQLFNLLIR